MSERGGEVFCSTCKEWHAVNENLDILGISEDVSGRDEYQFICPSTEEKSSGPVRICFGMNEEWLSTKDEVYKYLSNPSAIRRYKWKNN